MKCVCGGCIPCYIGVYQCGLWSIVRVCVCWAGSQTHTTPNTLNLHHEPPLHTPLPQPGEHKPPVPTQTDLYNTP